MDSRLRIVGFTLLVMVFLLIGVGSCSVLANAQMTAPPHRVVSVDATATPRFVAPAPKPKPKPVHWNTSLMSTYGNGDGCMGAPLAGGGVLHPKDRIFAHKKMKFGTVVEFRRSAWGKVKCWNKKSHKWEWRKKHKYLVVRAVCKDRGPYVAGREFDVAVGAARVIHFSGVERIQWRIVKKP